MTTRKKSTTTTRRIDIADPFHAHGEVQVLEVAVVLAVVVVTTMAMTRRNGVGDHCHSHAEVQVLEVAVVVVGGTATKRRTGDSYPNHSHAEVQGLAASVEGGTTTMRNFAESEGRIVHPIRPKTKTKKRLVTRVKARSLDNMEDRAPGLSEVDPRHSLRMEQKEETERM
jgi:hypothetical protein